MRRKSRLQKLNRSVLLPIKVRPVLNLTANRSAMQVITLCLLGLSAGLAWRVLAAPNTVVAAWQEATALGGSATTYSYGSQGYTRAAPFLNPAQRAQFSRGAVLFNQPREDYATDVQAGYDAINLGVQFNARSCVECHVRDGRSLTQPGAEPESPLVLRLGHGERKEKRLRLRAISPAQAPAVDLAWRKFYGSYADGANYTLRAPVIRIGDVVATAASLRAAPAVYGLGLLEAIDDTTLVELANGHEYADLGITGSLRWIEDGRGGRRIGRFGWKGDNPSLLSQVRGALEEEIGVQLPADRASPAKPAQLASDLLAYMQLLGVGARTQAQNPMVQRGAVLFERMHCSACHVPTLRTGTTHPVAGLRRQLIHPYSDLLLHDMGPGLMSGESPTGRRWRTPPLWGIGLQAQVAAQAGYLHDGRARDLSEAILWHGGEGERSRAAFVAAEDAERSALLAFLASL